MKAPFWGRKKAASSRKPPQITLSDFQTGSEDPQKLAVLRESTLCLLRKDRLRENLAELDALLVEAVDVPYEALEHDLVLEMRKQCAENLRGQLVGHDDGRRAVAFEVLVPVVAVLAACECDDLGRNVRGELLLAGRALDHHVVVHLVVLEADELQRDDVGALVAAGRRSAGRSCRARRR